jgi:hypothetical protein
LSCRSIWYNGLSFIKSKKESQMAIKEKGGFGGVPGGDGFEGQQIGGRGRTAFGSADAARGRLNRLAGPYPNRPEVSAPVGRPGFREKTGGQGIVAFSPQYRGAYPGSPIASARPTTLRPRPGDAVAAPVIEPAAASPSLKAKPSRPAKQEAVTAKRTTKKAVSGGTGIRTGTQTGSTVKQAGGGGKMKETASQRQSRISKEKNPYRNGGLVGARKMGRSAKKR